MPPREGSKKRDRKVKDGLIAGDKIIDERSRKLTSRVNFHPSPTVPDLGENLFRHPRQTRETRRGIRSRYNFEIALPFIQIAQRLIIVVAPGLLTERPKTFLPPPGLIIPNRD